MTGKNKFYKQKFNEFWYNDPHLNKWIDKPTEEDQTASCRFCKCNLNGSKRLMWRHAQSLKHKQRVVQGLRKEKEDKKINGKSKVKKDSTFTVSNSKRLDINTVRQAEMRLCAYVAEHNLPLSIMDTLPGLIKSLDPDSKVLKHIQCSHTKTAYIMKNALATHTLNHLAKKLQANLFSLLVDDSQKFLTLVVRYFDEEANNVDDSFLNILDIESSWSTLELYQNMVNFLQSIEVPVTNLLALAQYSSSTTTETTSERLQEISQYVYVPGFVSHSFHLCVSEACKELPASIEELCNDIYKFIQKKSKRLAEFGDIQDMLNVKSRNFLKLNTTARMCSIHKVVEGIVENWDAFLSFFSLASLEDREEKAESILQCMRNPVVKEYFLFLNFFLPSVDNLAQESQTKSTCLPALLAYIEDQLKTVLKFYMQASYVEDTIISSLNPEDNRFYLTLDQIYYGTDITALKQEIDPILFNDVQDFQIRCVNFYVEFCRQLKKRVDFTDPVLRNLLILSPPKVRSDYYPSVLPLAKLFPNLANETTYEHLDREWRLVKHSSLSAQLEFMTFWNQVFHLRYGVADARPRYPYLTKFVKAMCCLPHSSAATERIFSNVAEQNTKLKTKRETPMINSLLLVKEKLKHSSAKDFEISDELVMLVKGAKVKTEPANR